ncbi:LysR family transcriptional regulator, partial [Streptomyces sp. NPDC127110]|uniref:LysR family transcriptional regulator n=1 Tax=Streptomyces sp. NPDC127110 TaxID=3345362 RepID=UPI0036430DBE
MDLTQLRTLREVVRSGSLTKAARGLGYSQSSVTAHIRHLESRIGTPLFQRLPHGVRLTAAGETFMEYADRMFDLVEEANSAFGAQGAPSGRVAVGTGALLIDGRIGALLRECRYRYPQVCLSPQIVAPSRIEAAVLDGDIHLGLTVGRSAGADTPAPPAGLSSQALAPVELVPVGGPAVGDPQAGAGARRAGPGRVGASECPC